MRKLALLPLLLLSACGQPVTVGAYTVIPALSVDTCSGQCPSATPYVWHLTDNGASLSLKDEADGTTITAVRDSEGKYTWRRTGTATSCSYEDVGNLDFGQDKFTGRERITYTCGTTNCLCSYVLTGKR